MSHVFEGLFLILQNRIQKMRLFGSPLVLWCMS